MLNRVFGVTGACVTTSLHPNPSAQTMVPPAPHTEHDSEHHQQSADDRGAWRVVGVGHIDSHGRDGQVEGDKDECLHGVHHRGFRARSVTEARPRSPHQTVSVR
jgi:hypothetical protein